MPLNKSGTKAAFSDNVSELMHSGRPQKQAVAIAYSIQRRGHADGGSINANPDPDYATSMARRFNPRRSREMSPQLNDFINSVASSAPDTFGVPSWALGHLGHPELRDKWRATQEKNDVGNLLGGFASPFYGAGALMKGSGLATKLIAPPAIALGAQWLAPGPQADQPDKGPHMNARDQGYAVGGSPPWFVRNEARDMSRYGMMHGATPGRADLVPTKVRGGAYVFPADVVSAFGQGNSMAGANSLNRMFKMGPYGTQAAPMPHAQRTPMPHLRMAQGGEVPIKVSDGEFLVPPEKVAELGGGDMNHAHDILDRIVELKRKENIAHLMSLPPPRDSKSSGHADGSAVEEETGNPFSSVADEDYSDTAEIPEPLDRNDPMLHAIQGYGFNPQYGKRFLGIR